MLSRAPFTFFAVSLLLCVAFGSADVAPNLAQRQAVTAIGTLSMLQPPVTATPSLIKVISGNPITFSWTLLSVSPTPTSLTIQAFCSQNAFTYPLGSVPGAQPSFVWDPFAYEQSPGAQPLAQASYTMRIFDERGFTALPTAGQLSPANGPIFALYHPAAYTPLANWKCSNCLSPASMLRAVDALTVATLATALALCAGSWSVLRRIDW